MYNLGSKSKAPTSSSTTTTSTGSRSYMMTINDLIKHKYDQKNKNRKCRKMTAQLKEEKDDKLMMQSMMAGAKATITHAPLPGADATATTTHAPLRGGATTAAIHAPLQGVASDDNIDGK